MTIEVELNIAEISPDSGAVRLRYTRHLASDSGRWIRHGLFVGYHEIGIVCTEGRYVEGTEHGVWRDFYANGQLASEGSYHEGREVGA